MILQPKLQVVVEKIIVLRVLSNVQDPKRDELTMSRMNPDENWGEVRTRDPCNSLG